MKKSILTLTCIVLAGIITTSTSSCGDYTSNPLVQAYWQLAAHTFTPIAAYVYLSGNYTNIEAVNTTDNTHLYLYMKASNIGTYTGTGMNTDAGTISLSVGSKTYSSNLTGGSASIDWSLRDDSKMWLEATYSGTVVNQSDPLDKLDLSQGIIKMKFEF